VTWCDLQLGGTVKVAKVATAIEEFREEYARAYKAGVN
jgi:hypothetical protein